jgi:hypothetical protein
MSDNTLTLTLTVSGIPSEAEAAYVRDHIILLAKMASYETSAKFTVFKHTEDIKPELEAFKL